MLIPIATIKQHLRIDDDPNPDLDAELERLLEAATDHASQYIGRPIPWTDDAGAEVVVPASVKAGILLIIGDLYENREDNVIGTIVGRIGNIERLLHFYRVGLGV